MIIRTLELVPYLFWTKNWNIKLDTLFIYSSSNVDEPSSNVNKPGSIVLLFLVVETGDVM